MYLVPPKMVIRHGIPIIKGENSLGLMRMSLYHVKLKVFTEFYDNERLRVAV